MKHFPAAAVGAAILAAFLVAGCDSGSKNYTVAFNGYLCSGCTARFYTEGGIHAQQCPKCKGYAIEEVVTYVCPTDETRTVSVRRGQGGACKQCRRSVSTSAFPTDADLKEWGATLNTKAEVGAN